MPARWSSYLQTKHRPVLLYPLGGQRNLPVSRTADGAPARSEAYALAKKLRAGTVWVNCYNIFAVRSGRGLLTRLPGS